MLIRFIKVIVTVFCLISLSHSSVFANSMNLMLLNGTGRNDMGMITTAIANGADLNCLTDTEMTPLYIAMRNNNIQTVDYLLTHGADPNLITEYAYIKERPLNAALHMNNRDSKIIYRLIDGGADVNGIGGIYDSETPLNAITGNNNERKDQVEILKYLISKGADVNLSGPRGTTPLMQAVQFRNLEIGLVMAKILLKAGADPELKDNNDSKAIDFAIKEGNKKMINLLMPNAKLDIDESTTDAENENVKKKKEINLISSIFKKIKSII